MADEHTPTTDQVRKPFFLAGNGDAFDRWLAAREVEVRERIATEIHEAAVDDGMSPDWRYGMRVAAGIARGATR